MELAMMAGHTREARANFGEGASAKGALTSALKRSLMLSSALVVAAAILQVPASAQTSTSPSAQSGLNIAAQPLSRALVQYSNATGVQLFFNANLVRGKNAPALRGSFSTEQAMSRLLAGSGLSYRISGNTVTIVDPATGGNNAGATVDGAIALDTIDVSGGNLRGTPSTDAPYQTPGAVSYISGDAIERFRGARAGDLFKGTPGVLSGANNNGAAVDVNVRGMQGMNRVNMAIDGTQQSASTYLGYPGVSSRVYVDPDLLAGVDIEKGPSGGPLGAGFIGGVVNMRTIDARDIVKPGMTYGVRLRTGISDNAISPNVLSSVDRSERPSLFDFENGFGNIAAAAIGENIDVSVAYARRKTGNYFSGTKGEAGTYLGGVTGNTLRDVSFLYPKGTEVHNTSENSETFLLKAGVRLAEDQRLELGYIRHENRFGEVLLSQLIFTNISVQEPLDTVKSDTVTMRYAWNPTGNDLINLRINAWAAMVDEHQYVRASLLDSAQVGIDTRTQGINVTNTSTFIGAYGGLSIDYGASYSRETSKSGDNVDTSYNLDGERLVGSAFSQFKWDPISWLRVDGGLRYDIFETQGEARGGFHKSSGGRLNPSVGATIMPLDGIQIFTKYSEGFRPATIREIANPLVAFDPDLRPETSSNWEVGANFLVNSALRAGDKFRLKISYFDNAYENYIARTVHPTLGFWMENLDGAEFSGVELQAIYDAGFIFGEVAITHYTKARFGCPPNEDCSFGSSYQDYSAYHMPPETTASLMLGVRLFDEALTLGGRITYASERANGTGRIAQRAINNYDYTIIDLFGSYKFNEGVILDVSANNLTDRFYMDALSKAPLPAPGRTIRGALTFKF